MLGKKAIAIDDAFELAFGVVVMFGIFLLFGFSKSITEKNIDQDVSRTLTSIDNSRLLVMYLQSNATQNQTFSDFIAQMFYHKNIPPQTFYHKNIPVVGYYFSAPLNKKTHNFFDNILGESWKLKIFHPHYKNPLIIGWNLQGELFSAETFITTPDGNILNITLVTKKR